MSYQSINFIVFSLLAVALYYLLGKKMQVWVLAAANLAFYIIAGVIFRDRMSLFPRSHVPFSRIACPFFSDCRCDFPQVYPSLLAGASNSARRCTQFCSQVQHSLYNDLHLPLGIGRRKPLLTHWFSLCNTPANPLSDTLGRKQTGFFTLAKG